MRVDFFNYFPLARLTMSRCWFCFTKCAYYRDCEENCDCIRGWFCRKACLSIVTVPKAAETIFSMFPLYSLVWGSSEVTGVH